MLRSKLHCQKGFKLKPFFYKIGSKADLRLPRPSSQESFRCLYTKVNFTKLTAHLAES